MAIEAKKLIGHLISQLHPDHPDFGFLERFVRTQIEDQVYQDALIRDLRVRRIATDYRESRAHTP